MNNINKYVDLIIKYRIYFTIKKVTIRYLTTFVSKKLKNHIKSKE